MLDNKIVFGLIAGIAILIFFAANYFMGKGDSTVVFISSISSSHDGHANYQSQLVDEPDPVGIFQKQIINNNNNKKDQPEEETDEDYEFKKNNKKKIDGEEKKEEKKKSTTTQKKVKKLSPAELAQKLGVESNWYDDQNQTRETSIEERVTKLPMAIALRQFSTASWETVKDGNKEIMCSLLIMASKNCEPFEDTLEGCVVKLGYKNLEKILSNRCINSQFWRETLPRILASSNATITSKNEQVDESENAWKKLKRGVVWDGSIIKESDIETSFPYIEPADRVPSIFPPPRVCHNGCKHYPIGFGLPLSNYEESVPRTKNFAWMPLLPKHSPAQGAYEIKIEDEDLYHEMHSQSFFGWTHKRGGWECMRSHDELAAGTIPFFWDLHSCPSKTLGHYPKDLLKKAMELPGVNHVRDNNGKFVRRGMYGVNFIRHGEIRRSNNPQEPIFNLTQYYDLADQIHAYAKKYMSTRSIAAYMLKCMDAENTKRALIFTRGTHDYTETTVIHGLADLGINVTVVSVQQNYDYFYMRVTPDGTMTRQQKDNWLRPLHDQTYGASFGYSGRYPDKRVKRPWIRDANKIMEEIKSAQFDIALWQLSGGNYEFIEPVKQAGIKRGFLKFHDWHGDPDHETMAACRHGGTIFVREMSDQAC